jgi:hypothetical protein
MFTDILPHRVNVYRLQDIGSYDFTGSTEGEVTEVWGLTAVDVKARFEPEDTPFQRRADGIADIGTHTFYTESTVDIVNADRVYRALGEGGPEFFSVQMVKPIRDSNNILHHKEIHCTHIDWEAPTYTTVYMPGQAGANVSIRQMAFSYTDTSVKITDIALGDWLQSVAVQMIVPYDDPAATLSIIDSEETLLETGIVDLTALQEFYEKIVSKQYSVADDITLVIDPGDSTQGAGYIFVKILMT